MRHKNLSFEKAVPSLPACQSASDKKHTISKHKENKLPIKNTGKTAANYYLPNKQPF